jgi:hypothetical protein
LAAAAAQTFRRKFAPLVRARFHANSFSADRTCASQLTQLWMHAWRGSAWWLQQELDRRMGKGSPFSWTLLPSQMRCFRCAALRALHALH